MLTPTRTIALFATLTTIPLALVGTGLLVSTASYSSFSATTSNSSNNWAMGTVALSSGSSNSAAFNASNLKPGSTGTNCIAVTSSGSLPSVVKLYATNASQTNNIGDWVNLQIDQGTGGGNGTCNGFTPLSSSSSVYNNTLGSFVSNNTGFSNGVGNWVTAGGSSPETRTFRFTYTVSNNAPSSVMGGTASLNFTWEAQNQ